MKTYTIKGISKESFEEFNKRADELGKDKGIVYIDSSGGTCVYGYEMIRRMESLDIELVLINGYSMGFTIFDVFKGNKRVGQQAQGVIHAEGLGATIFKYKGEIKIRCNDLLDSQYTIPEFTGYDFLTDEENKIIGEGGQILLEEDRLKKIYNK